MLLRTEACGQLRARLQRNRPHRLETLRATFYNPPDSFAGPSSGDAERVLSLFDPERAVLSSSGGPDTDFFQVELKNVAWTRVRSLSLHRVHGVGLLVGPIAWGSQPAFELPAASLEVQFDLVQVPADISLPYTEDLVVDLINATNWLNPQYPGDGIMAIREFCFRVDSGRLQRYIEKELMSCLAWCGCSAWEIRQKMTLIRFELVQGISEPLVSPHSAFGWLDLGSDADDALITCLWCDHSL